MRQLIHNGVHVTKYVPRGLHVLFQGKRLELTPEQEEMAVAWSRIIGTQYEQDSKFVGNFFRDFAKALGVEKIGPAAFDFTPIQTRLEAEKADLSLKEARKASRLQNKERYGYVILEGRRIELSNYAAEPSSIFRGRGKAPLRGRWKPGPKESDIELNLSPDAPSPPGNWAGRVWRPDELWVARWRDKLREEVKYIWLPELAPQRQAREQDKYDLARELEQEIVPVRAHIRANLKAEDLARRKIATVAWLIDDLKFRVGDEKDDDEADTVGATTLRPEHIKIHLEGTVTFDFIGKDSVRWNRTATLPPEVSSNLREFIEHSNSAVFDGIRSDDVNAFFGEAMPGLTAKVFRTYHATKIVRERLAASTVEKNEPEYEKIHIFKLANLAAAVELNHKKTPPKSWRKSYERKSERLNQLRKQLKERRLKAKTKRAKEALRKASARVQKLRDQIELMRETKTYNLNTSLKNYIDPRVPYRWCQRVGLHWHRVYPKSFHRKFAWAFKELHEVNIPATAHHAS
jgi:DNA topoisomerase-1